MPDETETPSSFDPPNASGDARPVGVVSPPPSSGSNIFLKVCLVLGSIVMVGSCAALLSPTGREVTQSTFEIMTSVGGAAAAPGTNALREIGCDTALVMPFDTILNPMARLSGALGESEGPAAELADVLLVQCSPSIFGAADLSCEQIARTYGAAINAKGAAGATEEFVVMLESADESACMGFYLPDGTLTRSLDDFENGSD